MLSTQVMTPSGVIVLRYASTVFNEHSNRGICGVIQIGPIGPISPIGPIRPIGPMIIQIYQSLFTSAKG